VTWKQVDRVNGNLKQCYQGEQTVGITQDIVTAITGQYVLCVLQRRKGTSHGDKLNCFKVVAVQLRLDIGLNRIKLKLPISLKFSVNYKEQNAGPWEK
jgi:hypothetical protein